MTTDGVFPTEMPDDLPLPIDQLDDDTAERLLSGRLPPEDAPPSFAEVARFLRAAAAPPTPGELAGQPAALAAFRAARAPARRARVRPAGAGRAGGRARLVAVALAGTLAVGGLWIAAGAQTAPGLRSPTGGPATGGSGSATSGSLRPAMPATGPLTTGQPRALPSDRDRAAVGNGAAAAHRTHPGHPRKPPRLKPPKPKADKPKAPKPQAPKPKGERLKPEKPYRNAAIRVSASQRP